MPDVPGTDERKTDTALSRADLAAKIAERKRLEAEEAARVRQLELESDLADETIQRAFWGGTAFGVLGLIVAGVGFLYFRDVTIGLAGTGVGLVGFGVISVAQYMKIRGVGE